MRKIFITILFCLFAGNVFASDAVNQLQKKWDHITYEVKNNDDQKKQMQELTKLALYHVKQNPKSAEVRAWAGIILSSEAGYYRVNVVKAMSLVKKAKTILEETVDINPSVLNGSIYATLGSLYSEVPPFPIGFGDKGKAKNYFDKALAISADDIENNYFYAQFLFKQKQYQQALTHLEKAKNAPKRNGRSVADNGRRKEIDQWILKVRKKMS